MFIWLFGFRLVCSIVWPVMLVIVIRVLICMLMRLMVWFAGFGTTSGMLAFSACFSIVVTGKPKSPILRYQVLKPVVPSHKLSPYTMFVFA